VRDPRAIWSDQQPDADATAFVTTSIAVDELFRFGRKQRMPLAYKRTPLTPPCEFSRWRSVAVLTRLGTVSPLLRDVAEVTWIRDLQSEHVGLQSGELPRATKPKGIEHLTLPCLSRFIRLSQKQAHDFRAFDF
jgi:hypothetical protein